MKKKFIYFIVLVFCLTGCFQGAKYDITNDGFKSNQDLWGLRIAELDVDSMNDKGFPKKYTIIKEVETGQKGDHKESSQPQKYGYQWKPQKYIPFRKVNKYYNWWIGNVEYDTLPLEFQKQHWYLLTKWKASSTGGGTYDLFVYVTENGEFEKHFNVITNM
jgi:hypothetical protein